MKAFILPPVLLASLAACAGSIETRIASSGLTDIAPYTYMWAESAGSHAQLTEARQLVSDKLAGKGLTRSEIGALYVEITLAARPAELGLTVSGKDALAPPKQKKLFGRCSDNEYRLGIAITRINDGASIYRSSASEYHCETSLASAMPYLVEAALADLGQPQGSHIVKRPVREPPAK